MASTLARWVVEKGVDNINPAMLSADMRNEIMTEAGMILLKEGRFFEAVKAVTMAGNSEKLSEMGDEFVRQTKFEEAALCFIPVKNKEKLLLIRVVVFHFHFFKRIPYIVFHFFSPPFLFSSERVKLKKMKANPSSYDIDAQCLTDFSDYWCFS